MRCRESTTARLSLIRNSSHDPQAGAVCFCLPSHSKKPRTAKYKQEGAELIRLLWRGLRSGCRQLPNACPLSNHPPSVVLGFQEEIIVSSKKCIRKVSEIGLKIESARRQVCHFSPTNGLVSTLHEHCYVNAQRAACPPNGRAVYAHTLEQLAFLGTFASAYTHRVESYPLYYCTLASVQNLYQRVGQRLAVPRDFKLTPFAQLLAPLRLTAAPCDRTELEFDDRATSSC